MRQTWICRLGMGEPHDRLPKDRSNDILAAHCTLEIV